MTLCCQSNGASRAPAVRDIWRDTSCGYERHVRVEAVSPREVLIIGVEALEGRGRRVWVAIRKAKRRWTRTERFTSSKPDFEFIEVAP